MTLDYYPFGLKQKGYNYDVVGGNNLAQNWKFNGMELSQELGLETYDFGARNYDPAIGRWMNLDPLAELMTRHSPYNYAFDNPIYFIDPDGMTPVPNAVSAAASGQTGFAEIGNGAGAMIQSYDSDGNILGSERLSSNVNDTYVLGKSGKLNKVDNPSSGGGNKDKIYSVGADGSFDESIDISTGSIKSIKPISGTAEVDGKLVAYEGQQIDFGNKPVDAEKTFNFMADNVSGNVEFGLTQVRNFDNISQNKNFVTSTLPEAGYNGRPFEVRGSQLAKIYARRGLLYRSVHSHPISNFGKFSTYDKTARANLRALQSAFNKAKGKNYPMPIFEGRYNGKIFK